MAFGPTEIKSLEPRHLDALATAEARLFHCDFCPYLELRELLKDDSPAARQRFRVLFSRFYQMTPGRLTDEFENRFFEILFDGSAVADCKPRFDAVLGELYEYKRAKGDKALQFSFVSKMVNMCLDSSPIFDKHVLSFFEQRCPATSKGNDCRVAWFVSFLDYVGRSYLAWAQVPAVAEVLKRLRSRDAKLETCHVVRLMDFLVWKAGNERLLKT